VAALIHSLAGGMVAPAARARRRALQREDAARSQRQTLALILRRVAGTQFAREHSVAAGRDLGALPVQTYESLLPWIERALGGGRDVLWPGLIERWAVSSGTTAGTTKYLPITDEMVRNFRRGGLDTLHLHVARCGRATVFGGRQLFLGGSTALEVLRSDPRILGGDLSGIMALRMPWAIERWFYSPGRDLALLADWPRKVKRIAERAVGEDVRVVAGIPSWLLVLFEALQERWEKPGRRLETLHDVWPNLELIVHGGVSFAPYRAHFERWLGKPTAFQEVYPASEGFVAVQDEGSGDGLRLLTDAGLYFEFLPVHELRAGEPRQGARPLPLAEVELGVPYALVLTTPGGLLRYLVGDVVRFVTLHPPRILFVGRTRLELSAFGEHVIEHEVTQAMAHVAERFGLAVRDFHVAPVFPRLGDPGSRGRHQWMLEIEAGDPDVAALAAALDEDLQARNDDYRAKRRGAGLVAPEVLLLPRGAFQEWMRSRGKLGGQHKVPRLRSDRQVADGVLAARASAARAPVPPFAEP